MVGKSLSHYKITAELGRGGMGIVYRAEDTKLDRTVAIKVLPSAALSSEEDRARFYREAKAAAQLHHPHIAGVFEIDEAVPEGSRYDDLRPFIAMEYIEGETLQDRISSGPLKLDETVRIAREIASGLEAAHEKNIVHRDIKGANVMLTVKGSAKILDFGLAQTAASTKLTRMGSTLGTVAYMSPEQTRGEEVDLRTDLWSLGVIMYEMISGRMPFRAEYDNAAIYLIVHQDPEPLTAVRTGVPMELERIVFKLLTKESSLRYQSSKDLLIDLERLDHSSTSLSRKSSLAPSTEMQSRPQISSSSGISTSTYGLLLLALIVGFATAYVLKPNPVLERPVRRFIAVDPSQVTGLPAGSVISTADISPDGSAIAFHSDRRLWVLRLDELEPKEVRGPGTGGFTWTPDSKGLIYGGKEGWIRVLVNSLESVEVAKYPSGIVNWRVLRNGTIAAVVGNEIMGPFGAGVVAKSLAGPIDGFAGRGFIEVPNGKGFLTFREDSLQTRWLSYVSGAEVENLKVVPKSAALQAYSIDERGYLVYQADDINGAPSVWALKLDLDRIKVIGEPRVVAFLASWPTISRDGILVYTQFPAADSNDVFIYDRNRRESRVTRIGIRRVSVPEISPDNRFLAFRGIENEVDQIWLADLRDGGYFRLTEDVENPWRPTWSPTGLQIAFQSQSDADGVDRDIYVQSISGVDESVPILTGPEDDWGPSWSPDGEWLVFTRSASSGLGSIYRMRVDGSGQPELVVEDTQGASFPSVSPDGQFLVYSSIRGGRNEIFIASYPGGLNRERIVTNGGIFPKWRGNRIFWIDADKNLVSVDVGAGASFTHSEPDIFLTRDELQINLASQGTYRYDVSFDGNSVVVFRPTQRIESSKIVVVQNWLEAIDFERE